MALRRDVAVAGDDVREVELLERRERLHPILRVPVADERHPANNGVAGHEHFLLRQVDEDIAVGVRATDDVKLDLTTTLAERRAAAGNAARGRDRVQLLQL